MKKFEQLEVDFSIPQKLQESIDALQLGVENEVSYIDCLQDEVHANSRYLDDDEKERVIIDYYCNRRW